MESTLWTYLVTMRKEVQRGQVVDYKVEIPSIRYFKLMKVSVVLLSFKIVRSAGISSKSINVLNAEYISNLL